MTKLMDVITSLPFIKMVRYHKGILSKKNNSPCVITRSDNSLYLDYDGEWIEDMHEAKIAELGEMYEIAKKMNVKMRNKIVFLILKI